MDSIRGWVAGVCCAAVACTLMELLHPSGTMKKAARYVTALFFLAALVIPTSRLQVNLPELSASTASAAADTQQSVEQLIERQTISAAEASIESMAQQLLSEIGVRANRISATVKADASGAYGLTRLEITLSAPDRIYAATIRARVSDRFGLLPELNYTQQTEGESP